MYLCVWVCVCVCVCLCVCVCVFEKLAKIRQVHSKGPKRHHLGSFWHEIQENQFREKKNTTCSVVEKNDGGNNFHEKKNDGPKICSGENICNSYEI